MSFIPAIRKTNILTADQAVASSITPVDIQNSVTDKFNQALAIGKAMYWEIVAIFTLGATGGFRFLAHYTAAVTTFNASFYVAEATTPARFDAQQTAEAAFANAAAVAATYKLWAKGYVLAAAAGTFSFQFAQNASDVLPITMKAGARMYIEQF